MGFPRAILVAFLLVMGLLQYHHQTVAAHTSGAVSLTPMSMSSPANINCGAECGRRCSKTKRKDKCNRACMSCCHTCGCVPPGTAGNKDVCPCYANLLNPKNGVHKCP